MNIWTIIKKIIFIIAVIFITALPFFIEYISYRKDIKNGTSHKRFRTVVYTVIYSIGITIALYYLGNPISNFINNLSFQWIINLLGLRSKVYMIEVLAVIAVNAAIGYLHGSGMRIVRIGEAKADYIHPKKDNKYSLFQKINRVIVRFFHNEVWLIVANIVKWLSGTLSLIYTAVFTIALIPVVFENGLIPYAYIDLVFIAGYLYPVMMLLILWEVYFFLAGVNNVDKECPELAMQTEEQSEPEEIDLEKIDEEIHRQFHDYYACDLTLSASLTDKNISDRHNANTLQISNAIKNDERNPQTPKEIYLECLDKLFDEKKNILINGSFFSEFSMYFLRYISSVIARGDNVVFITSSDSETDSVYEYLRTSFSEISSLHCKEFLSETVDFDDPIWKIARVKGDEADVEEATIDEKSILITTLKYLSSSKFEKTHQRFIRLIDTIVFVDTLEAVNRYSRQMAVLNTRLNHITEQSALMARNGNINESFRIRYMSKQVRYICFDDSRISGMDKVLKNILSVDFDSADTMRFTPNTIVRCYNYEGRPDSDGKINLPQFIDSREEIGAIMNVAMLCLACGAKRVNVFADGDIPYENIRETIAANTGRIAFDAGDTQIQLNKRYYNPDDYSVIIAMDSQNNLPQIIRKYISVPADKKTLILIFSKPYLLRNYYYHHIDSLWSNTQLARIPLEEGSKKEAIKKILIKSNSGGIAVREVFKLVEHIPEYATAAQARQIMPILYSIVDFYNLNDQDKNENGMLSAGDKQKIYRYFDFVTINDFDKDGQFCSEDRILLRKGSRLFDIINGRDLITLKTGEKTITLPISNNRICQNYITGQNMIASGNIYHIINISPEAGIIEARLATGGMNTEVYHYVQARTYRISATGHELLQNNHILLKRSLNGITITDAYLTVLRTPAEVLTSGYYDVDPHTLSLNVLGNSYHSICDAGNDALAKQTYRRYGSFNIPQYAEKMEYSNKGLLMLLIRLSGTFGESMDKAAVLAAAMMNELLRSMFPAVADSIVVCPVIHNKFSDEESQNVMNAQPQMEVIGTRELLEKSDDFELAIIEDCATDIGVVSALASAGEDTLNTLFAPIYAYLKWYEESEEKDSYLYYGYNHEPACFDFHSLYTIAKLLGDNGHALNLVKRDELINNGECDFCGRKRPTKQISTLQDGRKICGDCAKSLVKKNRRSLKEHLTAARLFIESTYGVTLDKEYRFCFETTEKIIRNIEKGRASIRTGDIPLYGFVDDKKRIHVEYNIPSYNLSELLVRELTHAWQIQNTPDIPAVIAEGHVAFVALEYLCFMSRNAAADTRRSKLLKENTKAGIGYREIIKVLNKEKRYHSNPFEYALMLQNGEEYEINIYQPQQKERKEENYGESYQSLTPDRAPDGKINYFYYSRLIDSLKSFYDNVIQAIETHNEIISDNGLTAKDINKVSTCIEYDRPDLFQFSKVYSIGNSCAKIIYRASQEETNLLNQQMQGPIQKYLTGITNSMSAYDVAVRLYTRIIDSVDYDTIALNDQKAKGGPDSEKIDYLRSICGVFLNQKAVCEGYARALQFLLQRCGVECAEVAGNILKNNESPSSMNKETEQSAAHAWNIAKIDGEYYYLDVTWDDSSNTNQRIKKTRRSYDYFCVTTEEIERKKKIDLCPTEMPVCSAVKCNYYRWNKLYLPKYDIVAIKKFAEVAALKHEDSVTFKCGSKIVYDETVDKLFGPSEQGFEAINSARKKDRSIQSGYSYSADNTIYTITLIFRRKE